MTSESAEFHSEHESLKKSTAFSQAEVGVFDCKVAKHRSGASHHLAILWWARTSLVAKIPPRLQWTLIPSVKGYAGCQETDVGALSLEETSFSPTRKHLLLHSNFHH